jgi:RHS repeat-associated protein
MALNDNSTIQPQSLFNTNLVFLSPAGNTSEIQGFAGLGTQQLLTPPSLLPLPTIGSAPTLPFGLVPQSTSINTTATPQQANSVDPLVGVGGVNTAITAEGTIVINNGGDFDGNPLITSDDALIYAGKGFTINKTPIFPVQRDANGAAIVDNKGRQILVKDAISVTSGFTTLNAPNNPYSGLVPPQVVDRRTVEVPAFTTLKQQELVARAPSTLPQLNFNPSRRPLNTAQDWKKYFPTGGTVDAPTIVKVPGNLTIPDGVKLENTVLLLDKGDIKFNGKGQQFNNVVLVAHQGNVNLARIQATDLTVLASGSITMNREARFGGNTLLANGSSNGIIFNGATFTVTSSDFLKVVSQGRITYNADSATRGQFISQGDFSYNSTAELVGSIATKRNIYFNSRATVTAVTPQVIDTTPPEVVLRLQNDTGVSNSDRITFDPTIVATFTDASPISRVLAGFNPAALMTDVTAAVQNSSLILSRDQLAAINGGSLLDGDYILRLQAQDQQGNLSSVVSLDFKLDTTAPSLSLDLAPAFDTAPLGDQQTLFQTATLIGQTEAGLTVGLQPTNTTITADATGQFSLTNVALAAGDNPFTLSATDVAGNQASFTQTIRRPVFNLSLREDTFFRRTVEQSFQVPDTPSMLRFSYADLKFDTSDPNFINDAFEAVLVDANGKSLVYTIGKGRDAFFNLTEGQPASLAAGVTLENQTVSLNLAGIAPGTEAKLILRLVNDDTDINTAVQITNVELVASSQAAPTGIVPQVNPLIPTGFSFLTQEEFNQFSDVSASFAATYGQTSFNETTQILYVDLAVKNAGQYAVDVPLLVAIDRISDPSVQVANPQGITPDGHPYFNFTALTANQTLAPGQQTGNQTIAFYNPNNVQFDYELVFLGRLTQDALFNQAPKFTSTPVLETQTGAAYSYQSQAVDADNDTLTYSLLAAPATMRIDRTTGAIEWNPTAADVGSQTVKLRVEDGKGGAAEQFFTIVTQQPLTNRIPVITSTAETIASVSQAYTYNVDAIDPDNDTLTYSLTAAPPGMTIDPGTGVIRWETSTQLPGNYDIAVQVQDGRGGSNTQTFRIALNNLPSGEIRGVVWDDLNANGARDSTLVQGSQPDVVFIIDVSFSADDPFQGTPVGDLNGDGRANTILDAEIAGFMALNQQLIRQGLGQTADVGIISFAGTALASDMNPSLAGRQLVTNPAADKDNNGILDVEEALRSLRTRPFTNFEVALQAAETLFQTIGTTHGNGNIIFLSDGVNTIGGSINDEVTRLTAQSVNLSAFGVGQGAALDDGDGLVDDLITIDPQAKIFTTTNELLDVFSGLNAGQNVLEPGLGNVQVYLDVNHNGIFDPGEPSQRSASGSSNSGGSQTTELTVQGTDVIYFAGRTDVTIPPLGTFDPAFPLIRHFYVNPDFLPETKPRSVVAQAGDVFTFSATGSVDFFNGSFVPTNSPDGYIGTTTSNLFSLGGIGAYQGPQGALLGVFLTDDNPANTTISGAIDYSTVGSAFETISPGLGQIFFIGDGLTDRGSGEVQEFIAPAGATRLFLGIADGANVAFGQPGFYEDNDGAYQVTIRRNQFALETGEYRFTGLSPGTYTVRQVVPEGYTQTFPTPTAHTVNLSAGEIVDSRNFGNTTRNSSSNQAPVFTSTAPTTTQVGALLRYEAKATDADGDVLTYDLLNRPTGMVVDPDRGIVIWQPAADQIGTQEVVLRVRDRFGGSALQTFQLIVIGNQPPTITSAPINFAKLNQRYEYTVMATDPENQPLTFSLINAPTGMTIDSSTGVVQWTPTSAQIGDYQVTIAVQDPFGNVGQQNFTLTAGENAIPVITSTPMTAITAGLTYRYDLQATDPDGDRLTYSLTNAPQDMTIDALGRLTWTTTAAHLGTTPIQIVATDEAGAIATQSFNLTVTPDRQAPKVNVSLSNSTIEVGKTVTFNLAATDDVRATHVSLSINGQAVDLAGGRSTSLQITNPGLYTVEATATDAAGNIGNFSTLLRVVDPRDTNAPVIQITSPSTNSTITTLTNILGSVNDTDLDFYRVEYAPLSLVDFNNLRQADPDFITLAQGNNVVNNGVLTQFDPTLLANDSYVLRVIAQDINGNTNAQGILLNVSSDNKLGNFRLEFTDLSIPLGGIPITVDRIYDTLQSNQSSDFGFGWSLGGQDARIQESVPINAGEDFGLLSLFSANAFKAGDRVTLTNPEGRRVGFTFNPVIAGNNFFGPLWKPQFTADAGVYDTLADANDSIRLIRASDGSFRFPFFSFAYNPTDYKLTTKAGLTYTYDQFEGLEEIRDRNGNTITFNDAGITSSTGATVQFARDAQGRITKVIDPAGKAIQYSYDAKGDLIKVTDQAGLSTTHDYLDTRSHYLEDIIDARGKTVIQTQYDAQGRVIGTTDALGRSVTSTYQMGADTSTTTEVDPLGNSVITTRDNQGNVIVIKDEVNATTTFTYDANNNLIGSIDARGFTTTHSYDGRGNLTSMTNPLGQTQSFTYDAFNNVTSETDQLGRVTRFVYNSNGNLIEFTNAAGQVNRFSYDNLGRVISFVDAKNQTTTYGYNSSSGLNLGKPTLITFPDGSTQRVEYNQFGQITRLIDENGHATQYVTDAVGRLVTQRDALGNETTYTYDAQLITSITDPLGNTARFEYDNAGRLIRQIAPSGGVTQFGYDALGRQTTETDPLGRTQTTTYRADGLIASITDAEGNITTFEYDLTDNQTAVVDPLGQRTTFAYDALGRQIRKTDPLGNSTTYGYDAVDNLIEVIDRNNRRRQFTYNAVDQLTQETWFSGSAPIRTIRLAYDQVGNLISTTDADSAFNFSYNNRDRLTQVTGSSPTGPSTTLTYTYDAAGNRLSVTDNLGARVVSTYDPRNLLTSQTWQGSSIDPIKVEYSYDQRGDRTETKRFADTAGTQLVGRTTYNNDASQRLTSLTHFNGSNAVLADYQYAYNLANQLTSETADGQTTTYTYDRTNQLTNVDRASQPDETYSYDDNGNQTNNGSVVGTNNQIASNGTFNYSYDKEGNLTAKTSISTGAITTYSYDHRNRLTTVIDKTANGTITQTVEFIYDAFDRRISKTVNGQTTHFTNDGDQLWAEYNQLGQVIARYLPGADIDELIARYLPGDDTSWYLSDRLGTIRDVANQFGSLINQIDYNSFGQILNQTDASAGDRFAFTGREYDEETGLYYYRARYYDPTLGRFISQDPIGFGGEDPNLYRYVGNNPVNATDPSGLLALVEYAGIASETVLGQTGSVLTAIPGFLQGFGSTSLVFIGYVLEIANSGGDVIAEWGSAIDKTAKKMEEIKAALEKFNDFDRNGIVGGFINGAGFELKNKITITVGAKIVGKSFSIGAEASGELTTTITLDLGGGFTKGYEQGLAYLRALQPR